MIATGRAAVVLAATWDPSIIWNGVYLAGALLAGAIAIEVFRRYMRGEERQNRLSASDQLAQFRSLYEEGALSEEEYNRLRTLLGGELRKLGRKPAPATEATPAPPQTVENPPAARDTPLPDRPTPPPETGIKSA